MIRKIGAFVLAALLFAAPAAGAQEYREMMANTTQEEREAWYEILNNVDFEAWMQYEDIPVPGNWFAAYRLSGNVIAIVEFMHEQCVCSFLIPGKDKALLLDTCTGIQNLRKVVESLTDLPVLVLNSHDHFDHIGGNSAFDEVWCYHDANAIRHLTNGPTEKELEEILQRTKSLAALKELFEVEIPDKIPGKEPTGTVEDGQIIDLGGRKLEVIHTPGHQPSCIMLLDRENRLLFTGDMFYPGPMYCQFDDSSFPDYVKSIRKAAGMAREAGVKEVYTSHNLPATETETLCDFADFLERIESGAFRDYTVEDGFRTYSMNKDISIVLPDDGTEPVSGFSMVHPE
jgi:glyoxylase-like metal-dependent hydrolase (beta-lactamase superfamily II)